MITNKSTGFQPIENVISLAKIEWNTEGTQGQVRVSTLPLVRYYESDLGRLASFIYQ